ncbi:MAG: hypothetical protein ACRC2S_15280 [Waterburya sp.]
MENNLTTSNIELEIEELILHGFPVGDRDRIGMAVQQELTRLITEEGIPTSLAQGGEIPRLDGGTFNLASGVKAEVVGTQIAQSIYGGLGA